MSVVRARQLWVGRGFGEEIPGAILVASSQVIGMGAAFGVTVLLARWLTPASYGVYALVVALLLWIGNFSEIGVFSAASRLLAHADDVATRRDLVGTCLFVAIALFVLFGVLVAAIAPFAESVFDVRASRPLLFAAPVAGGLALEIAVQYLCQGTKRSSLLATRNLIARPVTLALVVAAHLLDSLTVTFACWAFALGSTVAACIVFARLRPTLGRRWEGWAAIRAEMKRANDGAMYVGRVVGSSLFNIDRMLIAYFLTSTAVGYYALAFSLVAPITLGVQSIAIAGYAGLARSREIPRSLLRLSAGWLLVSSLVGYVLITLFIDRFLPAYRPALGILVPAVLTAVALGIVALFNQFFTAHGHGRTLRRISIVFAIANLSLYLALIPLAGIKGAAYASLATVMVPLIGNLIAYRRYAGRQGAPVLPTRVSVASPPARLDTRR
jgi:O-antigen/teichoic acid export membrane protein